MQDLRAAAGEREADIVAWRRALHRVPELAHREEKTSGLVAESLKEMGLTVREGVGGTGVVGLLEGGKPGKVVALRADMDALPIQEETGLSFASTHPGTMHACGHDAHMAMALGAVRILRDLREEVPGRVKVLFQPAEEEGHPGGAAPMIEDGALEDPVPDYVFGFHVWSDLSAGLLGYRAGPAMASTDTFRATVRGHGGHGARPHQAVDPVVVAAHAITALQTVASREVDPLDPFVLTVGKLTAGTVHNVIPREAYLEGTLRTLNPDLRASLQDRLDRILGGVAAAFGAEHELELEEGYPTLMNDPEVTQEAAEALRDLFQGRVQEVPPTMGGEDFSRYLERVPGAFLFLGTRNEEKGLTAPIHNPRFQVDEDVLPLGAAALARLVFHFGAR